MRASSRRWVPKNCTSSGVLTHDEPRTITGGEAAKALPRPDAVLKSAWSGL